MYVKYETDRNKNKLFRVQIVSDAHVNSLSVCCVFLRSLLNIFHSVQCAIWNRKRTSNRVLEMKQICRYVHNNKMEMTNDIQMCTMWILFQIYKIQNACVWLNFSKAETPVTFKYRAMNAEASVPCLKCYAQTGNMDLLMFHINKLSFSMFFTSYNYGYGTISGVEKIISIVISKLIRFA